MNDNQQPVYEGRHLSMMECGEWEFATRNVSRSSVGIVAFTSDRKVVVVEQFRPPVARSIIELPAGLVGDLPEAENESLLQAAKRELLEETGYSAKLWVELGNWFSSPGITDESISLFLASDLTKTGPGGGDASESSRVHEAPIDGLLDWLKARDAQADLKLLAGVFAATERIDRSIRVNGMRADA